MKKLIIGLLLFVSVMLTGCGACGDCPSLHTVWNVKLYADNGTIIAEYSGVRDVLRGTGYVVAYLPDGTYVTLYGTMVVAMEKVKQ